MERVRVVACESKQKSRGKPAFRQQFRHELPPGVTEEEARRRCVEAVAEMIAEAAAR